jgi:hypothetical protein
MGIYESPERLLPARSICSCNLLSVQYIQYIMMTIIIKEEGWVFAIFSPKESAEKSASPRMKFNPLIIYRIEQ